MCHNCNCCCDTKEELHISIVSDLLKKMQDNRERSLGEAAIILINLVNTRDNYNKISKKRIDILVKDVAKQSQRFTTPHHLRGRRGRYSV